jgi:hypothetical protein
MKTKTKLASPYDLSVLAIERIKQGRGYHNPDKSPYTLSGDKALWAPKKSKSK